MDKNNNYDILCHHIYYDDYNYVDDIVDKNDSVSLIYHFHNRNDTDGNDKCKKK